MDGDLKYSIFTWDRDEIFTWCLDNIKIEDFEFEYRISYTKYTQDIPVLISFKNKEDLMSLKLKFNPPEITTSREDWCVVFDETGKMFFYLNWSWVEKSPGLYVGKRI